MKTNKLKIVLLVAIITLIVLLFPIQITCKTPGATCASVPDSQGNVSYVYDVEPLVVVVIEYITKTDFPFVYNTFSQISKK